MDRLPPDILHHIASFLAAKTIYRNSFDVGRDAVALYCAGKVNYNTRLISKTLLESLTNGKHIGGFEPPGIYCILEDANASVKELKNVCRALGIPVSGTKNKLVEKIKTRQAIKSKLILDDYICKALQSLRYKTISAYVAKSTFGLTCAELAPLLADANSYKLQEVKEASIAKFGSEHALSAYLKAKELERARRFELRHERLVKRRVELEAALEACGCIHLLDKFAPCSTFIKHGTGNLEELIETILDLKFLKEQTHYNNLVGNMIHLDIDDDYDLSLYPEDIHYYARRLALEIWVLQHRDVDINTIIDVPDSIKRYIRNMPRYFLNHNQ